MKLMKFFSLLMFVILCCTTYAHENKYIFIGQNGSGESVQTAFVLEISAEEMNDICLMNEDGEIRLKADKVTRVPVDELANFFNVTSCSPAETATEAAENSVTDNESWGCPRCKARNTANAWYCWRCGLSKP